MDFSKIGWIKIFSQFLVIIQVNSVYVVQGGVSTYEYISHHRIINDFISDGNNDTINKHRIIKITKNKK